VHFFSKKSKKVLDRNEKRVYSVSKGRGTLCLKLKKRKENKMNKYLKYALILLAVAVVFVVGPAMASPLEEDAGGGGGASGNVFQTVIDRMLTTFRNARSVIFVVGGFGLIGLGFAAIFGKVNWKWLAALACGLAIVAVAGQVVDYVTQHDSAQHAVSASGIKFRDTLTEGSEGYSSGTLADVTDTDS
jgi:type IV secretory pathway VirB2 component (pilin)